MTLGRLLSLLSPKENVQTLSNTHLTQKEKDRDSCESIKSKKKCREEKEGLITSGKSLN